tara:strand:- start:707 stop:1804 length:1098 start_codon:yes stop_codon:yes gene_type:complete
MKTFAVMLFTLFYTGIAFSQIDDGHIKSLERTIPRDLSKQEHNVAELYTKVVPAVVTIFTRSQTATDKGVQQSGGLGSGILVSGDCHILTAAHVVAGDSEIMVKTQDGKMRKATVLFSEANADIALLKLVEPDMTLEHAVLGDSDKMVVGQSVYAIGSPYGLENSFSSGIISAFRGFNKIYDGTVKVEFIQTDAAINSGNSGGPLFNSSGEVVGIASSILTVSGGFQGIGMAVSINTAKDILSFEDRPWMGVDGILLQKEEFAQVFNMSLEGGVIVQSIAKGSPADKAGLRAGFIKTTINGRDILLGGDIITAINNHKTCHAECLTAARTDMLNTETLVISYLRAGKSYTATLDVSETRKNFLTN